MILAIDIGNTTVTLGGVRIAPQQAYSLEFTARIDINHTWSASQYESAIEQLFDPIPFSCIEESSSARSSSNFSSS